MILSLLLSLNVWAQTISCDYFVVANVHFATVKIFYDENGRLLPNARIVNQAGRVHEESIDGGVAGPGESFRGWISKGTNNELEMVIFAEPAGAPRSKLINHGLPMGKEMWGACKEG